MYTYNTKPRGVYSTKDERMIVSQDRLSIPGTALLLFMSAEMGVEYTVFEKKAYTRVTLEQAFRAYRKKIKNQKVMLVMDQLPIHVHQDLKQVYDELEFKYQFVLSYSPDLNPVETIFSCIKRHYLKLRTE